VAKSQLILYLQIDTRGKELSSAACLSFSYSKLSTQTWNVNNSLEISSEISKARAFSRRFIGKIDSVEARYREGFIGGARPVLVAGSV